MASFPGSCQAVAPAQEENGELDGSLQQMLKAIADERNRLNSRQELSGIGESRLRASDGEPGAPEHPPPPPGGADQTLKLRFLLLPIYPLCGSFTFVIIT